MTDVLSPDFIVVGAAKCGTTTVASQLARHPQIFMTDPKEPGYFSGLMDEARYRALFEDAGERLKGEATTAYSRMHAFPGVPAKMFAECPDLRLIYLIRHPVERIKSAYAMRLRDGRSEGPLHQVIRKNLEYIDTSRYGRQMEHYLDYFDRPQFLILRLEDLKEDPESQYLRMFEFLGVSAQLPPEPASRSNARPPGKLLVTPHLPAVLRPLGSLVSKETRVRVKRALARSVANDGDLLEIPPLLREILDDVFTADMARLRRVVGPDLDLYGYA
ncbi:MAG: sulfotransferase [Alphaproteobacteria bacterium]|nr:sulfotransferase [Alphaproteobacteria bacterium]